jgi:hypothetical protein
MRLISHLVATGGPSHGVSATLGPVFLKVNWVLGLNGMNWDVLDGRTSSTNRAFASDRTIKISDSMATTFGPEQLNSDASRVDLSLPKAVTDSTPLRCRVPNHKALIIEMSPNPAADCWGSLPTRTKQLWSRARLGYRIMVDMGLTFAGASSRVSRLWLSQQLR